MVDRTKMKRLSINLSLFTLSDTPSKSIKSPPKNFEEPNGVVGLGILAAMNSISNTDNHSQDPFFKRAAILAISPRSSNPIPILSNRKSTSLSANNRKDSSKDTTTFSANFEKRMSVKEMELCEEYTCVISHAGENQIKKREYFDDGSVLENANFVVNGACEITNSGLVSASSAMCYGGETPAFHMSGFLDSCFLCKKNLHGLDIYMYRGEKAFCSAECRYKQMSLDEHKEKCVSGAMKPHEYSVSPCSGTLQFFAGVAAA